MSETPETSTETSAGTPPVSIRTMVEEVVRELVSMPDAVRIEERDHEEDGERFRLYELHVDTSDLGKVIGKNGRTARALRALVNALAAKLRMQAELEIIEPDRPANDDMGGDDAGDDRGDDEGGDAGDEGDEGSEEDAGDDEGEAGAPDA